MLYQQKIFQKKGAINEKKYSGLFIKYLQHLNLWDTSKSKYSFGNSKRIIKNLPVSNETIIQHQFISTSKEEHHINVVTKSGYLWDTNQEDAIEKGNLIHDIMSHIETKNDIDAVIVDFLNTGIINPEQALNLKKIVAQIVEHPQLQDYYTSKNTIYNERDIITKEGLILRPDRVVVNATFEAIIIDYKTGTEDKKHVQQLQLYQDVLEDMDLIVKKKILVYINDDIKVKDV